MATGAVLRRADGPIMHDFGATTQLGHLEILAFGFPIEIEDLLQRTNKFFGVAMAIQTPTHALWLVVIDDIHVIDVAVATHATHAAIHMHRVVKINVIRRVVNSHPRQRLAGFPSGFERGEFRIVLLDLRMAVHASLRCGNV